MKLWVARETLVVVCFVPKTFGIQFVFPNHRDAIVTAFKKMAQGTGK
ncbi:MAG: hypothetical protein RMK94_10300 [Armatimonadota bacterium]|nr:hypothetical protein [Armatimonadota bacterium]